MQFKATTNLTELRRLRCDAVNALRAEKLAAGFVFEGNRFDIDQQAMVNISGTMAALSGGLGLPPGFAWRSADNVDVPMDAAKFGAFAAAAMGYVSAVYAVSWGLKDAINAASEPEQVNIVLGWPA